MTVDLLPHAKALLHLSLQPSPCCSVWPLRALACGTPVAAWESSGLSPLIDSPGLGLISPDGQWEDLADGINGLPPRASAAPLRRQAVLSGYGRRPLAARFRQLYQELLENS